MCAHVMPFWSAILLPKSFAGGTSIIQLGPLLLAVFEIAFSTLVDIRSTNELIFGGPALILVDRRKMQ